MKEGPKRLIAVSNKSQTGLYVVFETRHDAGSDTSSRKGEPRKLLNERERERTTKSELRECSALTSFARLVSAWV